MYTKHIKYLKSCILLLFLVMLINTAKAQRPTTSGGWENPFHTIGAELGGDVFAKNGVGLSISYQTGKVNRHNKTRKNMIEIAPGIGYIFSPDNYVNLKFRVLAQMGIPFTFGAQYNYITGSDDYFRKSAEVLLGFAHYPIYVQEVIFWKFMVGYDFEIETNNEYLLSDRTPITLHIGIGYRFR